MVCPYGAGTGRSGVAASEIALESQLCLVLNQSEHSTRISGVGVGFLLNGRSVTPRAGPQSTLLDFLRSEGLTGAKEGCAEGECGACTVVLVADRAGRSLFRTVNSCLMFLPMAAGQEIYTVEALAENGQLADVQRAMAASGGSQCGYCTPGFVMSLFAEQYRPGRTGPCDVHAMSGNLCRCTGYRPIRDAAASLGAPPDDRFSARLRAAAPSLLAMDADAFSRPATIGDCLAALTRFPGAKLVAGATDLGVEANLQGRRWPHLISLDAIPALRAFSNTERQIEIGSALSLSDLGDRWEDAPPAIAEWLTLFASPPIRNRATLGGNLATASPIGDAAPLLLALDASITIEGPGGRRSEALSSFFTGYRTTRMGSSELLTSIVIPKPLPQIVRFYKVAKRPVDDISTVAAGMALDRGADGRVRRARFAFGGVAATPVRLTDAEQAIEGRPWDDEAVARVKAVVERSLAPMSDHRGSKEYRHQVAASLVEKFRWQSRS